jgi:excisionase family DNA binding protein
MRKEVPTFEDEFLTTKQIADALKKNLSTIQRWCREGKIPAARIEGTYIVRRQDFDYWFKSKLPSMEE